MYWRMQQTNLEYVIYLDSNRFTWTFRWQVADLPTVNDPYGGVAGRRPASRHSAPPFPMHAVPLTPHGRRYSPTCSAIQAMRPLCRQCSYLHCRRPQSAIHVQATFEGWKSKGMSHTQENDGPHCFGKGELIWRAFLH
jgi:hypothetical protein